MCCLLPLPALTGCGRYADFALPCPAGQPRRCHSFDWKPDPAPVLSPGDWDSVDVLNPSVVRRDGIYYNFYSGFDGKTWHTGLATSADGIALAKARQSSLATSGHLGGKLHRRQRLRDP